jgi:hypothetical protein
LSPALNGLNLSTNAHDYRVQSHIKVAVTLYVSGGFFMKSLLMISFLVLFAACSSHPIKPEADNVKVSRDEADKDCKELGDVEGRVKNVKGTFEEALEDLKLDAARKGANYVHIQQSGAMGQSVRGAAYFCD